MQYDVEMLRKIDDEVNLIAYAEQNLELEARGGKYWAHCPKHRDDTASLCFNPEENYFHCFSCNRSGGIIDYLRDFEGLSFEEAVKKGARLANLDLGNMCKSETISFLKRYKKIIQPPNPPYIHKTLPDAELYKYSKEQVQEWIDEGISQDVMDLFGIRVDTLGNRIVYPVYDINGKLINIKGRTRYPNYKLLKLPKYINYYKVGTMDYFQGLNITLPFIEETGEIIIFESIKSIMKAYGWGYKNCVSAEKHTLTDEQVMLLAKLNKDIVFAYDSDVDIWQSDVRKSIDKLKRITNVYVIEDRCRILGGSESKNSPVDLGREVWEELYSSKRKIV